jgi:nitroreductase
MPDKLFMYVNKTNRFREDLKNANFPASGSMNDKLTYLVKFAMLAPSSHNTQPWKFIVNKNTITFAADTSKWLTVADSDKRELYISLGCSIENLLIASDHYGMNYNIQYLPDENNPDIAAIFTYEDKMNEPKPDPLFNEILKRLTNRNKFEDRPVDNALLEKLKSAAVNDLKIYFVSDKNKIEDINKLVIEADKTEFANPGFRKELGKWLGRGAFGSGKFMSGFSKFVVEHINIGKMIAKSDSSRMLSSPVFGIIYSDSAEIDRLTEIMTGRTFERIYLTASMLGLSLQPMSQLMQLKDIKQNLGKIASLEDKILLQTFRLGYAKHIEKMSPRFTYEEIVEEVK